MCTNTRQLEYVPRSTFKVLPPIEIELMNKQACTMTKLIEELAREPHHRVDFAFDDDGVRLLLFGCRMTVHIVSEALFVQLRPFVLSLQQPQLHTHSCTSPQ